MHRDEDAVQVRWADDDWSVVRAEFSPTANRGAGIFYGATHDVFSWVPRRVEWCDARSGEVICTLETYTIEAGRRILTPELNCMAPKAMETLPSLALSSLPSLALLSVPSLALSSLPSLALSSLPALPLSCRALIHI